MHTHRDINNSCFILYFYWTEPLEKPGWHQLLSCCSGPGHWRERGRADRVQHQLLSVASGHDASYGHFDLLCSLKWMHAPTEPSSGACTKLHFFRLVPCMESRKGHTHPPTRTHTHTPCIMVFVSSSFPAPIWWQRSRQVPQMTIEIELTDESSCKTLAVMVLQLRLTAHISPWWLWCPASPRHLQEWAAWRSC